MLTKSAPVKISKKLKVKFLGVQLSTGGRSCHPTCLQVSLITWTNFFSSWKAFCLFVCLSVCLFVCLSITRWELFVAQVPDEIDTWRPGLVQHARLATTKSFPPPLLQMELPKQCPGRTKHGVNSFYILNISWLNSWKRSVILSFFQVPVGSRDGPSLPKIPLLRPLSHSLHWAQVESEKILNHNWVFFFQERVRTFTGALCSKPKGWSSTSQLVAPRLAGSCSQLVDASKISIPAIVMIVSSSKSLGPYFVAHLTL